MTKMDFYFCCSILLVSSRWKGGMTGIRSGHLQYCARFQAERDDEAIAYCWSGMRNFNLRKQLATQEEKTQFDLGKLLIDPFFRAEHIRNDSEFDYCKIVYIFSLMDECQIYRVYPQMDIYSAINDFEDVTKEIANSKFFTKDPLLSPLRLAKKNATLAQSSKARADNLISSCPIKCYEDRACRCMAQWQLTIEGPLFVESESKNRVLINRPENAGSISQPQKKSQRKPRPNVNARILAILHDDLNNYTKPASYFASLIKCSGSAVTKSPAWKTIMGMRKTDKDNCNNNRRGILDNKEEIDAVDRSIDESCH